jgi:hypothetical protein
MKKIIIIALGVITLAVLGYFALNLSKQEKVSDDLSLIDFAVADTAAVDRIEIYDSYLNQRVIVKRNSDNVWVDENGDCVKQELVETMLETFLKVTLKGYVPDGALENMKKLMMAKHKEVKIFKNGKWHKTWYVGHSTSDHYGTHMLLETPKRRSDNPVIMGMKGFYGILEPRFTADPKQYQCSELFSFDREEILSVQVVNNVNAAESFEIYQDQSGVKIFSNGQPFQGANQDNVLFYLNGFKNIHFNQPNYAYDDSQIDSIRQLVPDYILRIKTKHSNFEMNYHRRPDPEAEHKEEIYWDPDYLWGFMPNGELVRMQYYTIGPIIFGMEVFAE